MAYSPPPPGSAGGCGEAVLVPPLASLLCPDPRGLSPIQPSFPLRGHHPGQSLRYFSSGLDSSLWFGPHTEAPANRRWCPIPPRIKPRLLTEAPEALCEPTASCLSSRVSGLPPSLQPAASSWFPGQAFPSWDLGSAAPPPGRLPGLHMSGFFQSFASQHTCHLFREAPPPHLPIQNSLLPPLHLP